MVEPVRKEEPNEDLQIEYKSLLETIPKGGLMVVGLCYAIGILTVNFHLARFGYFSLTIFRIGYILAGIWAMLPIGLTYGLWHSLDGLLHLVKYKSTIRDYNRIILPIFTTVLVGFFLVVYFFALYAFILFGQVDFGSIQWESGVLALIMIFTIVTFFQVQVSILKKQKRIDSLRPSRSPSAAIDRSYIIVVTILMATVVIGYIYLFSVSIYSHIPAEVGGGQPKSVVLLTKRENVKYLRAVGIDFLPTIVFSKDSLSSDTLMTSAEIGLLLHNDNEYVLLSSSSPTRAISVKNDFIEVVTYSKPALSDTCCQIR